MSGQEYVHDESLVRSKDYRKTFNQRFPNTLQHLKMLIVEAIPPYVGSAHTRQDLAGPGPGIVLRHMENDMTLRAID